MPSWIDGALYPDTETPSALNTLPERIDFLARLCAAWDFGVLPGAKTIAEIRQPTWREAVDQCRLLTSPAYHLVRSWHNLPSLPYLGQQLAYSVMIPIWPTSSRLNYDRKPCVHNPIRRCYQNLSQEIIPEPG